ncbi:MAG TPA: aminotransferase class V-fold PLP-dependent enzyme [Polyangiaceae bacterium]|nr:aminotransferase class V-fold PLP-dependent enzyme [Polyangiaceae bacterium]
MTYRRPFDLEALRREYAAFLRPGRILLSGHSHQAWPDAARRAMQACFDDAAEHVDDKWQRAVFARRGRVARRVLGRLGFDGADPLAFGGSTHELAFRLLSCFPASPETHVVATTGEFHSLFRQLARLGEAGVRVTWVDASERASLAERLCAAIEPGVACVAVSAVLFEDAAVVAGLGEVVARAAGAGALPLVDAYHAFNVVPLDYGPAKESAFVLGGGYKYAQFGEGVCFLRAPPGSALRPLYTGWFAEFDALERPRAYGPVGYGPGGDRFAGSTFDPAGLYRAEAALDLFDRFGLGVEALRELSLHQTGLLLEAALGHRLAREGRLSVATPPEPARRGGFVALRTPQARAAAARLRERGVYVDARGDLLRLGPAPYLRDDEIEAGAALALEAVEALERGA